MVRKKGGSGTHAKPIGVATQEEQPLLRSSAAWIDSRAQDRVSDQTLSMTTNSALKEMEFEEGWALTQKGITKLKNLLEGLPEQDFNSEEYLALYTTIYTMCTQKTTRHGCQQLYDRYKESITEYIITTVLPVLREKHDEFMLRELVKRQNNYKIMVRWLSHFFAYLDRYFIRLKSLPTLHEVGFMCFRDLIYEEMKIRVKDVVITLIHREREGEPVDRDLLKSALGIFLMAGMVSIDAYKSDFEMAMLTDTAAYYSKKAVSWIEKDSCPDYMVKAEECLKREKERVGHYLHASSEQQLLETVEHMLLSQYKDQLLEEEHGGCQALLRDDKVEDLSRMYRLFCRIPKALEPMATMFRQHVMEKGTALVKQAEVASNDQKAERKNTHGGQVQAFVWRVIELHDKYLQYVSGCFLNHSLFQKALEEAFDVFYNKGVSGSSGAELLAIFCDNLLKKGGSDNLSDEAMEETLEKVMKLLANIYDKDLFAEFCSKKLARRLLPDRSASVDNERSMLTKLKQQFGGHFTSKMEGMVTDLTLARENQTAFEDYLKDNSTSNPGTDLTVTVLNSGCWPSSKSSDLALPAEMATCVRIFKEFYQTKTKNRKLTWMYSSGTCNINGNFDQKPIELIVTTYQAAVLLLFNAAERLTYADMKEQLNLTDEDIAKLLHSLSCAKYKILNKDPSTTTVSPADSFEFNTKFTDKARRIRIPIPVMDEKKKVLEDVDRDRGYAIEACIVRIMKSRKVLLHQQLVLECIEQLRSVFKPDIREIRKRIEDLVAREFLERDNDNPVMLRYLA